MHCLAKGLSTDGKEGEEITASPTQMEHFGLGAEWMLCTSLSNYYIITAVCF